MKVPEYITDLTREDLQEIARAANPTPGIGIEISKKADTIEIGISEAQFKRMVWAFLRNGGANATESGLDEISLDPQGN